jgi:hypothetical protein
MMTAKKSVIWFGVVVVLGLSSWLRAQTGPPPIKGQNAVVESQSGSVMPTNAPAFVDASEYGTDICTSIHDALQDWSPANSNGVVIDARAVSSLDCTGSSYQNPWTGSAGSGFVDTVLLPAGNIKIYQTWILISDTRIVGEGPNLTILQAGPSLTGDIVDMGGPPVGGVYPCAFNGSISDCNGVVIEHLGLNGEGSAVNGIVNNFSQELSYVNDVTFTDMAGTGLSIGVSCPNNMCAGYSSNSGPYSNLSYSGTGACLNIIGKNSTEGTNSLRGVHGLTCNTSNNPAIYLDGSQTTMEDITIIGSSSSQDGILIGSNANAAARADALRNIRGVGTLRYMIHISNQISSADSLPDVSDITILSASQTQASTNAGIKDDLTNTTLTDATVGMYALGEPVPVTSSASGYSRFTTSPSLPSWLSGNNPPSSSCAAGSIYTCTSNTCGQSGNFTLWGCAGQTWVGIE